MAKNPYAETVAKSKVEPGGRVVGGLRLAKVTYEHHPIEIGGEGRFFSLGEIVDHHICQCFDRGETVSAVSLLFETEEEQQSLRDLYLEQNKATRVDPYA